MSPLSAEIIGVGTELLLGELIDTNSVFLAGQLRDLGCFLFRKTQVGDNLDRLTECIRCSLARCDLVILTGGLGPTDDDLTREAIAEVMGETPAVDPGLLETLRDLYTRRGREMPEKNRKQAWLIPGATPLANPIGTACGWLVQSGGKLVIALPGPPREMEKMWLEQVAGRLPAAGSGLHHVTFHTAGIGEANIAEILGDMTQNANPSVATYARRFGVDVRVAASAPTPAEARALSSPWEARVMEALSRHVYGTDDETLSGSVGDLLRKAGETVGVAESLTGGLVADTLTDTPGASDYLRGCLVAYQNKTKEMFGLSPDLIRDHGVVSAETARAMAVKARELFRADWGLSTTGVAGPAPVEGNLPGIAYIGVSGAGGTVVKRIDWPGDRRQVKERTVTWALFFLWRALQGALKE